MAAVEEEEPSQEAAPAPSVEGDRERRPSLASLVGSEGQAPWPAAPMQLPPLGARIAFKSNRVEMVGTVAFAGETLFAAGPWVGITLDYSGGKHDGSFKGKRYFRCQPDHGLFVRPTNVLHIVERPKDRASVSERAAEFAKAAGRFKKSPSGRIGKVELMKRMLQQPRERTPRGKLGRDAPTRASGSSSTLDGVSTASTTADSEDGATSPLNAEILERALSHGGPLEELTLKAFLQKEKEIWMAEEAALAAREKQALAEASEDAARLRQELAAAEALAATEREAAKLLSETAKRAEDQAGAAAAAVKAAEAKLAQETAAREVLRGELQGCRAEAEGQRCALEEQLESLREELETLRATGQRLEEQRQEQQSRAEELQRQALQQRQPAPSSAVPQRPEQQWSEVFYTPQQCRSRRRGGSLDSSLRRAASEPRVELWPSEPKSPRLGGRRPGACVWATPLEEAECASAASSQSRRGIARLQVEEGQLPLGQPVGSTPQLGAVPATEPEVQAPLQPEPVDRVPDEPEPAVTASAGCQDPLFSAPGEQDPTPPPASATPLSVQRGDRGPPWLPDALFPEPSASPRPFPGCDAAAQTETPTSERRPALEALAVTAALQQAPATDAAAPAIELQPVSSAGKVLLSDAQMRTEGSLEASSGLTSQEIALAIKSERQRASELKEELLHLREAVAASVAEGQDWGHGHWFQLFCCGRGPGSVSHVAPRRSQGEEPTSSAFLQAEPRTARGRRRTIW